MVETYTFACFAKPCPTNFIFVEILKHYTDRLQVFVNNAYYQGFLSLKSWTQTNGEIFKSALEYH